MYISNAVEIGVLGVIYQSFLLYAAFLINFKNAITRPDRLTLFFAVILFFYIIRSMVEVPLYIQFSMSTIISIIAITYAFMPSMKTATSGARYLAANRIRRA
jgi:exopolysaccharide production protein ExoQ